MLEEKEHELHPHHGGPKEAKPEKDLDDILIKISGNKKALMGIRQIVIEFEKERLDGKNPEPPKNHEGRAKCAIKK